MLININAMLLELVNGLVYITANLVHKPAMSDDGLRHCHSPLTWLMRYASTCSHVVLPDDNILVVVPLEQPARVDDIQQSDYKVQPARRHVSQLSATISGIFCVLGHQFIRCLAVESAVYVHSFCLIAALPENV